MVIPLASIVSIAGLQMIGISVQQMSITGLIVALGLLVDGAIVMTDDVRKRLAGSTPRQDAVREAVRRLIVPLIASTGTTVLAFTPMALLPGPAGDFVGSVALSVIIMLVVSLVLALTITPALAGWMLPDSADRARHRWYRDGLLLAPLTRAFERLLRLSLRHPLLAIGASLILPVIGFGAFSTLKPQFFPGVDRDQFYVQVKLADGAAISETERVAMRIGEIIRADPAVTDLTWVIGENAPAFYYNMIANQDGVPSFAEALVKTRSAEATEEILDRLQIRLDAMVPEARITVRGLVQGPPVNAPVEIRIVGPNLDELRGLGEHVRLIMQDVPGVTVTKAQLGGGAPKIKLDLSEEKARFAGLNLGQIAAQMETRLEGMTGGSIIESSEELPVRVRVADERRASVTGIAGLDLVASGPSAGVATSDYLGLPISALGSLDLVPAEMPIHRRNGERINTVQGFVERNVLPEHALALVQERIDHSDIVLPPGYRFEVGGDSDARDEVLRNLLAPLGLIVSLTIAVVLLTFGSYRLAAVTAIVAVMSMGLSLLSLAVLQYPFGIVAVIGVIGSIGVSINAAIIIMTAFQADEAAIAGDIDRIAAVVTAQGRHIVSTTLTTFGGFLPLILAGGGFWPPFAVSIAGGVLLSTVVSFFFVPPAFALLARFGHVPTNRADTTTTDAPKRLASVGPLAGVSS
jgi:multidrug efflux pump subunit AcrB